MEDFKKWNLQQLVAECRKVSARHPDPLVRQKADKLGDECLTLITQPSSAEELEEHREVLRLKFAEFVNHSANLTA